MNDIILLLGLFGIKHFIVDFLLQRAYQYKNKGVYGHPGGLLHAALHGVSTWLCIVWFTPFAIALAMFDFVAHYHIDWAKTNINQRMGWGPNTHEEFWWLLGLDQFLHYLTYVAIIGIIVQ
jgi:hypothetical protein